MSRCSI